MYHYLNQALPAIYSFYFVSLHAMQTNVNELDGGNYFEFFCLKDEQRHVFGPSENIH